MENIICKFDKNHNKYVFIINASFEPVDFLMSLLYSIDIAEEIGWLSKNNWTILLDFFDLYDFLNPIEYCQNLWFQGYRRQIVAKIREYTTKKNMYDVLERIDCYNFPLVNAVKISLFKKYSGIFIKDIMFEALQKHKLQKNQHYDISKISDQTKNLLYQHYCEKEIKVVYDSEAHYRDKGKN